MSKVVKKEKSDRTIEKLIEDMGEAYKGRGKWKTFVNHHWLLRRVQEVYPGLRESKVTPAHFDEYPAKRRALADHPLKDSTIQNEVSVFKLLFRFECDADDLPGYIARTAAEKAGVPLTTLRAWAQEGMVQPGIQPTIGAKWRRWSDSDIKAVGTVRALLDAGISKRDLKQVGVNLRKHRPALSKHGDSYNEAFLRTKLVERYGDVCEPTKRGYISWLFQPGQELIPSSDRTLPELIDAFREALERWGKAHTLRGLRNLFKCANRVYPGLRESEITKDHFDFETYRRKREALAGEAIPGERITQELRALRRLFMFEADPEQVPALRRRFAFESDIEGYSTSTAARRAGVGQTTLYRWLKRGLFKPSIQPTVGDARWSDSDIKAVTRYYALFKAGFRPSTLAKVASHLRAERPQLATPDGSFNVVFGETNLQPIHGDICEVTGDDRRISWHVRPRHEVCLDKRYFEGFVETLFLEGLDLGGYHPYYVKHCRVRLRSYILPWFEGTLLEDVTNERTAGYLRWLDSAHPNLSDVERRAHIGLIANVMRSAKMQRCFTGKLPEMPKILDLEPDREKKRTGRRRKPALTIEPETETVITTSAKRPGRPSTLGQRSALSYQRKRQALDARRAGAIWKDVAKILYNTDVPTPEQINSAPSNVRNFEMRHAKALVSDESKPAS